MERLKRVAAGTDNTAGLRGIVKTRYLPQKLKDTVAGRTVRLKELIPGSDCAGIDYPGVVTGTSEFILYWRTLPWDHAPGALFLCEAGGYVARPGDKPYWQWTIRPAYWWLQAKKSGCRLRRYCWKIDSMREFARQAAMTAFERIGIDPAKSALGRELPYGRPTAWVVNRRIG